VLNTLIPLLPMIDSVMPSCCSHNDCSRGVCDTSISHSRHYSRDRQYECYSGI